MLDTSKHRLDIGQIHQTNHRHPNQGSRVHHSRMNQRHLGNHQIDLFQFDLHIHRHLNRTIGEDFHQRRLVGFPSRHHLHLGNRSALRMKAHKFLDSCLELFLVDCHHIHRHHHHCVVLHLQGRRRSGQTSHLNPCRDSRIDLLWMFLHQQDSYLLGIR